VVLMLCHRVAQAGPEEDPRAVEARKACAAGEVERGIKQLADYLATTDDMTAVYNMGRCYEQNGMTDRALLQFREYLRKVKDLSPADRADVEAHIKQLDGEPRLPPPTPAMPVAEVANASEGRPPLRTAGIAVATVGAASVALGVYFGLHTRSLEQQASAAPRYNEGDYNAGQTSHALQFVMYGIGAAAIVGGAILYYFGSESRQRVGLLPGVAAGTVSAIMRIRL
jgi:hypothetical protein